MIRLGKINNVIIYIPNNYDNIELMKKLLSHLSETDIKTKFAFSDSDIFNDDVYVSVPEQGIIFKSSVALDVFEQYKLSYKQEQEKVFTLNPEESKYFLKNIQNIKSKEKEQDLDFGTEENIMDYD